MVLGPPRDKNSILSYLFPLSIPNSSSVLIINPLSLKTVFRIFLIKGDNSDLAPAGPWRCCPQRWWQFHPDLCTPSFSASLRRRTHISKMMGPHKRPRLEAQAMFPNRSKLHINTELWDLKTGRTWPICSLSAIRLRCSVGTPSPDLIAQEMLKCL